MVSEKPTTDRGSNDERAFLKSILARHEELGLDETQFNALSRMYWDRSKRFGTIDTVAAVASTLSSSQFSRVVALMIPQMSATTHHALPLDSTVDTLVTEALDKRTKDRQLVEVELATKVAERVMGWAKLFAFLLAAPAALGLILLGAIGFSKFEDVQKASSAVDAKIIEAQTKVDAAFKKIDPVLDLALQNVAKTEQQLASVQNTLAEQSKKFAALNDTVTNLAENRRFALVFGNGAYEEGEQLRTAVNDAKDLAKVLADLNFSVKLVTNANSEQMSIELRKFRDDVPGAEIALLFFAGHSTVIDDETWLIPINTAKNDIEEKAIPVKATLKAVSNATRVGLVFIDACRKSRAFSGGCAPARAPDRVVLGYATQPGSIVAASNADNSVYAKALQKYMGATELELFTMLNEVGLDVMDKTNSVQQPWITASPIRGSIYLRQQAGEVTPVGRSRRP